MRHNAIVGHFPSPNLPFPNFSSWDKFRSEAESEKVPSKEQQDTFKEGPNGPRYI